MYFELRLIFTGSIKVKVYERCFQSSENSVERMVSFYHLSSEAFLYFHGTERLKNQNHINIFKQINYTMLTLCDVVLLLNYIMHVCFFLFGGLRPDCSHGISSTLYITVHNS